VRFAGWEARRVPTQRVPIVFAAGGGRGRSSGQSFEAASGRLDLARGFIFGRKSWAN